MKTESLYADMTVSQNLIANSNQLLQNTVSRNMVSLHCLVDELMTDLLPMAISHRSFILNDISQELMISTDENMLAYVLWNLLKSAISSTPHKCIRVEAILTGGCTLIYVKDAGAYFYRTISHGYRQVQFVAEKLGGSISIATNKNNGTTIAFTIYNRPKAA